MCAHRSNKYVQRNRWFTKLLLTFSSLGFNFGGRKKHKRDGGLRLTASNYPSVVIEVAYPEILTNFATMQNVGLKTWLR